MDTKKWIDAMYRSRQEPEYWFMTADTLKRGAELLFAQIDLRHPDGEPVNIEDVQMQVEKPAMLLLGLAFENTLKGYLLARAIVTWEGASDIRAWRTHDLVKLYELTLLELTAEERWLLANLSAFTVWAGKYPLCFKPEHFALDADHMRQNPPKLPPTSFDQLQRAKIEELLQKLQDGCAG